MQYYHDLITEKSWKSLQDLKKKYNFVLIGGWAVYLYSRRLKSKDIDLILDYTELEKLREEFIVTKNERLKKYEARVEETEIDVYLPYYSKLGIPAEEIKNFETMMEGFKVPAVEVLALLKAKALSERKHSVKGRKDLVDLVSLFGLEFFDFDKYRELTEKFRLSDIVIQIVSEIKSTSQIEELDLNVHRMSVFKKKILPLLS